MHPGSCQWRTWHESPFEGFPHGFLVLQAAQWLGAIFSSCIRQASCCYTVTWRLRSIVVWGGCDWLRAAQGVWCCRPGDTLHPGRAVGWGVDGAQVQALGCHQLQQLAAHAEPHIRQSNMDMLSMSACWPSDFPCASTAGVDGAQVQALTRHQLQQLLRHAGSHIRVR